MMEEKENNLNPEAEENKVDMNPEMDTEVAVSEESADTDAGGTGGNKIVISFVVTFLLIAVIVAFVVMTVIPLVSSKEKFFKISQNAGAGIGDMLSDFGDSVFGKILTIAPDEKLSMETDLQLGIETQDQAVLDVIYGFKNLHLTLKQDMDLKEKYTASDVKVQLNGEDFVTGNLLEDNTYVALKADGIIDKYLRAEKNNLTPVWERLGMSGPESFGSNTSILEQFKLTSAEQKALGKTGKRIFNVVKKLYVNGDFTEGEEVVAYNGTEQTLSYVDLKLTSKKWNDSVIAALEQILKETKSIDIVVAKLNALVSLYDSMGYENQPWTKEEFIATVESYLEELRALELDDADGVLVRVYYAGWDLEPLGLAMFMLPTDEVYDFKYADGSIQLIADGKAGYYEFADSLQEITDVVASENGVTTHNIQIRYRDYMTGEFVEEYTTKYVLTINASEKNRLICNMKDPDGYIDYTLSGSIEGNIQKVDLVMKDFYAEGETTDLALMVTLNRKPTFEKKVLEAEEYVDLNQGTDEEVATTVADVTAKWDAFTAANETKINQFATIAGAYLSLLMPYDPYAYNTYDYSDLMLEDAQG